MVLVATTSYKTRLDGAGGDVGPPGVDVRGEGHLAHAAVQLRPVGLAEVEALHARGREERKRVTAGGVS